MLGISATSPLQALMGIRASGDRDTPLEHSRRWNLALPGTDCRALKRFMLRVLGLRRVVDEPPR